MFYHKSFFACFAICLFLLPVKSTYAQKNFIKTDLIGYTYPQWAIKWARPYQQIKVSIAYERGLKNPHLTYGLNIGYGGTMEYQYEHQMYDDGHLSFTSTFWNYKGFSALFDFRYYNPFRKRDFFIAHPERTYSGFFIGIYSSWLFLKSTRNYFYRTSSDSYHEVDAINHEMLGLGGIIGYRQRIKKGFFIEALYGNAFELSGVEFHGSDRTEPDPRKNLRRLELSVGYAF